MTPILFGKRQTVSSEQYTGTITELDIKPPPAPGR